MRSFIHTLGIILLLTTTGGLAQAQIVVTSLDDNGDDGGAGDCELREALTNAAFDSQAGSTDCAAGSGTDTIDLTGVSGTIVLASPLDLIAHDVIIQGPGAAQLTVDGNENGQVFAIGPTRTVIINDVTVTGGNINATGAGVTNYGKLTINRCVITGNRAPAGGGVYNNGDFGTPSPLNGMLEIHDSEISNNGWPSGNGGGIYNTNSGEILITNSTIENNFAGLGGGILEAGAFTKLVNTTVSGNTASSLGGGLLVQDSLVLFNSTVTGNTTSAGGGGIHQNGDLNIANSVVAGNTGSGPDIQGAVTVTGGHNLVGDNSGTSGITNGVNGDQVGTSGSPINPMLFPLYDYGGGTRTHLPMGGSPALDAGSCVVAGVGSDQRGTSRPQDLPDGTYPDTDDGCDIGAVEVESSELTDGIGVTVAAFLEGPYSGSSMMSLALNDFLPTAQPYDDPHFDGTARSYDGWESVASIAPDVVDWVLVSVRTGTTPDTEEFELAAFLKDDGTIVGLDGGTIIAPLVLGNYYLVVRHRNHLSVMSSSAVDATSGSLVWDFRSNLANAYTSGGAAMKSLGGGKYGLFASDGNADGIATAPDFNLWIASTTAGETGYRPSDYNMDGIVTAPDFNLWIANTTAGAGSQVPD